MGTLLSLYLKDVFKSDLFIFIKLGYILFLSIGVLIYLYFIWTEIKKNELSIKYMYLLLVLIPFTLLGARIIPIFQYMILSGFEKNPLFQGGLVFYSALLTFIFSLYVMLKLLKLKFYPFFDIISIFIPLAYSFGRLGCFLAGCCYGKICDSHFGISYPINSPAYDQHVSLNLISSSSSKSLPVYPVQIYDSILNLFIFILLYIIYKRNIIKKRNGMFFSIYLILYSISRFFIEYLRGDLYRGVYYGISTSQFISIAILVTILGYFIIQKWRRLVKKG